MATRAPSLTIICATGGQRDLAVTTGTTALQLQHGDELIVTCRTCNWGHEARNLAMSRAAGAHLMFIDDDDMYRDGALDTVRQALAHQPDKVHLFAMYYDRTYNGRNLVQPRWPLEVGHVSTQMIVVPNTPGKLGRWGDRYEGDYDFIASTMALRQDTPVLHDDVIALIGSPQPTRLAHA